MELGKITEREYDVVRDAVSQVIKLRARADRMVAELRLATENSFVRSTWGIEFGEEQDGNIPISTPFGDGRAVLTTSVSEKGIQATITIQKNCLDSRDRSYWLPVWRLSVTEAGVFPGDDFGSNLVGKLNPSEIVLSILYAIAREPSST